VTAFAHHVETFTDLDGSYGWQCFTCQTERTGFRYFGDAEDAGIRHADDPGDGGQPAQVAA
jgi:hypothetical protein